MAEQIITIKNDELEVSISSTGAEIQKVTGGNTDFLWNGDSKVWSGRSPLLFPICGGLKDDKFILEGKEYTLQKHGYIRFMEFETEYISENEVTLLSKSNEYTKNQYPFDYEFRAKFSLCGNTLSVSYNIKNKSDKKMYFSVGAHEAYACPEGIEEYSVVFDKEVTLDSCVLNGNLLEDNTKRIIENSKELPLKYEYFKVDALVFKNIQAKKVCLVHNNSSKKVTLEFPRHDYFLLWTKPDAKYICLEPWCGIPDSVDSDYDITKKEGIIALDNEIEYTHKITFEEK